MSCVYSIIAYQKLPEYRNEYKCFRPLTTGKTRQKFNNIVFKDAKKGIAKYVTEFSKHVGLCIKHI